ncbi:RNA-binding protein [Pseudalkalibacillus berkeleyi]|uniref:RNA-binding protein n=1 Tax=Pseudalkalibacillus berkeleyi TaxID=1069813 RepID=A0ABS9GW54_9BACL|nr:RNA-binding protein [Pseudalkalibacillus berkeleyi]MCF6137029.1 RNA-binding protein [Pseudalkalibacillus berkeleyi]
MSIYDHFRTEEQPFIDQVLEWRKTVIDQYRMKATDFLDPREQFILRSLIGTSDELQLDFWQGYEGAERTRALMYPVYYEPNDSDFAVKCLELEYPVKFVTLKHSDILGALMSLGVKRKKFGDILMGDGICHLVVAEEIADYVRLNLTSIGKSTVKIKELQPEHLIRPTDQWSNEQSTVSSLRLDVILSEAFRLSRSKVTPFITNKKVKLNWKTVEQPSSLLQEGDQISVRGLGRAKLITVDGQSKKGKWKITYGTKKSK